MKTVNVLIAAVASLAAPWVQADAIAKSPRTAAGAKAVQLSTNGRACADALHHRVFVARRTASQQRDHG